MNNQQKINLQILSSNLDQVQQQVEVMKFQEMQKQLKLMNFENKDQDEQIELLYKEIHRQFNINKDQIKKQQELENEIDSLLNDLKIQKQKNFDLEKQLQNHQHEQDKLIQKQKQFYQILKTMNTENYSITKQIQNIYKKDQIVQHIINEQIIKMLQETSNKNIKLELKNLNLYCQEFGKIIFYVKDSLRQKELENKKLYQSVNHSIVLKENDSNKVSDIFMTSQIPENQLMYKNLNVIEEKFDDLKEALVNQQFEPFKNEISDLKEQNKILQEEKNALRNDIFSKESKINELQDLYNELKELLARNIQVLESQLNQNQQIHNITLSNINNSLLKDYHTYNALKEKTVQMHRDLRKYIQDLKDQIQEAYQQNQTQEDRDFIKRLAEQETKLNELEKENKILKSQLFDSLKKVRFMKLHNYQSQIKDEELEFIDNIMLKKYKDEIIAKNEIIINLQGVNDNLCDRLKKLQSERLKVLRDKQHAQKLYKYFKQKADSLHLMGENISRIVKTNQNLKQVVKSLINSFDQISQTIQQELQDTDILINEVHDEIRESVYLAIADPHNFNIEIFNQYLINQGKNLERNKRKKEESDIFKESQDVQSLKSFDNEAGQSEQSQQQIEIKNFEIQQYTKMITKYNKLIVEHERIKNILQIKEDKILELNKDLLIYQKKTKMIIDLEPFVDQVVSENIKIKHLLETFQKKVKQQQKESNNQLLDLRNKLNTSIELQNRNKKQYKDVLKQKKTFEKLVFTLRTKLDNFYQEKIDFQNKVKLQILELNTEIKQKDNKIKDQKNRIDDLSQIEEQNQNLKAQNDRHERDKESLNSTIDYLEKNLKALQSNNNTDYKKFQGQIKELKILKDRDQFQKENYQKNIQIFEAKIKQLNNSIMKKEKQIENQEITIREQQMIIQKWEQKAEGFQIEVENLRTKLDKNEGILEEQEINQDVLTEENEFLKKQVQEQIVKNNDYLMSQRIALNEELENKYQTKITELNKKIIGLQFELEGASDKAGSQQEIEDLKNKIKIKNKQLIYFNSFLIKQSKNDNQDFKLQKLITQNRNLLKEVELQKIKNEKLQILYDNFQQNIIEKKNLQNQQQKIQFEKDIKNLKASFLGQNSFINQSQNIDDQLQQIEDKLNLLQDENEQLQLQLEAKENLIEKYKIENMYQIAQIEALYEKEKENKDLNNQTLKEIEKQQELIHELQNRNQFLKQEIVNYKDVEQYVNKLEELNQNLDFTQTRNKDLQNQIEVKNKEIEELKNFKSKIENNENLNNTLEYERLLEEKIELEQQLQEKESLLNQQQSQFKQISQKLQRKEDETNQKQLSQIFDVANYQSQIKELQDENEELLYEYSNIQKDIQKLHDRIKRLTSDKVMLAKHIKKQKTEIENLQNELSATDKFLHEMEEKMQLDQDDAASLQIAHLKKEILNQQKKIKEEKDYSQKIFEQAQAQRQSSEETIQQLNNEILALKKKVK